MVLKITSTWIVPLLAFGAGMLAMYWGGGSFIPIGPDTNDILQQKTQYQFINPLLFCSDNGLSVLTNKTSKKIESDITSYIESQRQSGVLTNAAVYFRDLNAGPWVLVNKDMRSIPASLLKVPLAISLYLHAEKNPGFLTTPLGFDGTEDFNANLHFKPAAFAEPSKTYSVEQLIRLMLEDSDNGSLFLLGNQIGDQELAKIYSDFGIDAPDDSSQNYTMDVRTYASFFRVLYNGSYLSKDDSEHILSLLAQSTFPQGLEAGVPPGTAVAHKFGEFMQKSGVDQLHDCGIIYKPKQPYLLCVMTHGTDLDQLAKVIAEISKIVYQDISF